MCALRDSRIHSRARRLARRAACLRHLLVAALVTLPIKAAFADSTNTNIFSPVATPAQSIYTVSMFVLGITALIFVVVSALLITAVVRFRAKPGDDASEPPQIFGSNQIELAWTIIPILLVVVLFLATARMIFAVQDAPRPKSALEVTAIGHQFWWEFRYPKLNIVTANELHIPVSTPEATRPTYMRITSADVIHSFWVPRLAGKVDMIPNRINEMWMDPHQPGLYLGQCSQFCGTQHAKMLLRVYADTPDQFEAWVKQQQKAGNQDPAVARGRQEFESQACINCHTVAGTVANGRFGPDLTHLKSRQTLASGPVENNTSNLEQWIDNPDTFKPGSLMPSMHLSSEQIHEITAYLDTLR
jgi:cytochrome c oxidase subunit II